MSESPRAGVTAARLVHAQEGSGSTPEPATNAACAQPEIGPVAGVIKVLGVDDVLDAFAREENYIKDRQEMFEGRDQTPGELERWKRLFTEVQKEANKILNGHQVHLFACAPNPRGFGASFIGYDVEKRRYDVTLAIPMEERRNQEKAGRESFVRWMIGAIVEATLGKRQEYLRRGGLDS